MKSGFYKTTSNGSVAGWTEKKLQSTSQNQTCTKKRSRSLFDGLLSIWSTTAFWILAKPLHLRIMLSKWMRCNTFSWHWSTERAVLLHNNTSPHVRQPILHNWTNWTTKFCLIHHTHLTSHQPISSSSKISTFAGKTLPQPAGGSKCFPRVCRIPRHGFLCYRNKQTYFLLSKCWLLIVPILI